MFVVHFAHCMVAAYGDDYYVAGVAVARSVVMGGSCASISIAGTLQCTDRESRPSSVYIETQPDMCRLTDHHIVCQSNTCIIYTIT